MNKKDLKHALAALDHHWQTAWKQERILPACPKRREELHPSSFPYCCVRDAYNILSEGGDSDTMTMSAHMNYYVDVGTAVHLVLQEYMGKLRPKKHGVSGEFIGDWQCVNEKCGHLIEFSPYRKCPKCKSDTRYEELGIQFRKRTHGHVDGLYRVWLSDDDPPFYFVIDYKTSSIRACDMYARTKKNLPYVSNKFQIKSYAGYLERKYADHDLEISGWFLLYASRDTPMKSYAIVGDVFDTAEREFIDKYITVSDEGFHRVREHIAHADYVEMENVEALMRNKLCPTRRFYEENVHDDFDPCPLAASGKCFTGLHKTMNKLVDQYNDMKEED